MNFLCAGLLYIRVVCIYAVACNCYKRGRAMLIWLPTSRFEPGKWVKVFPFGLKRYQASATFEVGHIVLRTHSPPLAGNWLIFFQHLHTWELELDTRVPRHVLIRSLTELSLDTYYRSSLLETLTGPPLLQRALGESWRQHSLKVIGSVQMRALATGHLSLDVLLIKINCQILVEDTLGTR